MQGIYFIYNKRNKLIYLGQSKNIKQRIRQHKSSSLFKNQFNHYTHIIIKDFDQRIQIEKFLINLLKPFYNGFGCTWDAVYPIKHNEFKLIGEYFNFGQYIIYKDYFNLLPYYYLSHIRTFLHCLHERKDYRHWEDVGKTIEYCQKAYQDWLDKQMNKMMGGTKQ